MHFKLKKQFSCETTHILEKTFITMTPPIIAILQTRDLSGTPIVNILGLNSFITYFSLKVLFEIKKSRFTAKRRILEKKFTRTTPPFMAILPTGDLFGTPIVNMLGLKSFISYFSSKMLFKLKKSFYGETTLFREKC